LYFKNYSVHLLKAKHFALTMKNTIIILFTFIGFTSFSQHSEELIPSEAVSVFSINNISLLKKISLDELVKYEFMQEVQSELFDGSTSGKTIKDSGLDFDQKLNVYYGKNELFELSGFTFGISNKKQLFTVFDDFEKAKTNITGVELYSSYMNHLLIKGNSGIVIRVEPTYEKVSEITDSIWVARGNSMFFDESYNDYEEGDDYDGDYEEEGIVKDENFEILDEMNPENDLLNKNYWELRDSVTTELQSLYFNQVLNNLFVKEINLIKVSPKFTLQLTHPVDGIFYLDNSKNFSNAKGLWHFQTLFPTLYDDMLDLYTGNIMVGDIVLGESSVDVFMEANYGSELGSIYQKLNSAKFDKKVLKYVHKNNTGFFAYNINLKEGYQRAYDIVIPLLEDEKDPRISYNVLLAELLNEYVNTDALFDTYKGSMFGTFNGVKKVKTTRIEFFYDEETFEYGEREVESEEEMPIFTVGFSTNRNDIPEKVLRHFGRMTSRFKKQEKYWVVEEAVLNSLPLYIINRNGLVVFTNDEDLALNHADGYGKQSLSGKYAKKAQKSKFMYGYFDWGQTLNKLPREMFNSKQNEILDAMRGKAGFMELTSSKTTISKTDFHLKYTFDGSYDNSGKYLLDLVNSIYVLSK
jgi:hypothetical protein